MSKRDEEDSVDENKSGFSRRGFLRGAGLTAIGAIALEKGLIDAPEALAQQTRSPGVQPNKQLAPNQIGVDAAMITLRVNGANRRVAVEPRTTLAEALLFGLDQTGTKLVCNRGSCSACTVMLDKTPVCSCMTLALDAEGREITTIEGLAAGEQLHPVQAAFAEHDATMCGYCTPGMVMSCAALLNRNPNPTIADVKNATSGNLCRCGTYPKVFEAALAAARAAAKNG